MLTNRTAEEAIAYNKQFKKFIPPNEGELKLIERLKVDYDSVESFPEYKQKKLALIVNYLVENYSPKTIHLVMSQLNGYPLDEFNDKEDFDLKYKVLQKAKLSDWDVCLNGELGNMFSITKWIHPLIKVDIFNHHHGGVKKLKIYG